MIKTAVEKITPEKAKEYLRANTNNYRKLSRATVKKYAEDMKNGKWELNGESIVFSESWRIPWTEEAGRLQSIGSQKSQTWLKHLSTHHNKQKKGRNLFPSETVIRTST